MRRVVPVRAVALALTLLLGASATAAAWQARRPATDAEAAILLDFAARLAERTGLDRAATEKAFGVRLTEREHNDAFVLLEAPDAPLGAFRLSGIDVREPLGGGRATAGPILHLDVEGPCVDRPRIERRFGSLTPSDVPRGILVDEETVWSLALPGRTLGFGFRERDPDCLAAVGLDIHTPPTGANR